MSIDRNTALLSATEVASALRVSERTLARWVSSGRFPRPVTFGRARHWAKSTVDSWIREVRKEVQR
jgi:excisionase family DNA binding protein